MIGIICAVNLNLIDKKINFDLLLIDTGEKSHNCYFSNCSRFVVC